MIIGPAERLQLEIYTESGCARSCYSYQKEISNSWYAKCPCNEEFTVLEKCGVIFTGQTHLNKGNSPFNLVDTLSIFQFPFWNKHGHPVQCSSKHAKEQERLWLTALDRFILLEYFSTLSTFKRVCIGSQFSCIEFDEGFLTKTLRFILWVLGSLMTCALMVSSLGLSACFIFDKRAWVIYCSLS